MQCQLSRRFDNFRFAKATEAASVDVIDLIFLARAPGLVIENTTVLCVGLNSTDTRCSPGPGSTLKVPLGNGTALLRPEAENTRADLEDGPPGSESGSLCVCRLPRSASWRQSALCQFQTLLGLYPITFVGGHDSLANQPSGAAYSLSFLG